MNPTLHSHLIRRAAGALTGLAAMLAVFLTRVAQTPRRTPARTQPDVC